MTPNDVKGKAEKAAKIPTADTDRGQLRTDTAGRTCEAGGAH